jgi:hypothetical protein
MDAKTPITPQTAIGIVEQAANHESLRLNKRDHVVLQEAIEVLKSVVNPPAAPKEEPASKS